MWGAVLCIAGSLTSPPTRCQQYPLPVIITPNVSRRRQKAAWVAQSPPVGNQGTTRTYVWGLHSPAQVRHTSLQQCGGHVAPTCPPAPSPPCAQGGRPREAHPGLSRKPKAPLCPHTSQLWSPSHMMKEPNPFRETHFSNLFRQLSLPNLHTGKPDLLAQRSWWGLPLLGSLLTHPHTQPSPAPAASEGRATGRMSRHIP